MSYHSKIRDVVTTLIDYPLESSSSFTQDEEQLRITPITDYLLEVDYRINDTSRPKLIFNTEDDWIVTYFKNGRYNIKERMPRQSHIALLTESVAEEIEETFVPSTE